MTQSKGRRGIRIEQHNLVQIRSGHIIRNGKQDILHILISYQRPIERKARHSQNKLPIDIFGPSVPEDIIDSNRGRIQAIDNGFSRKDHLLRQHIAYQYNFTHVRTPYWG